MEEEKPVNKYLDTLANYDTAISETEVKEAVKHIMLKHLDDNRTPAVYQKIFNCIDLTTLNVTDSDISVSEFTAKVNAIEEEHPEIGNVAAVCVYPVFAQTVRSALEVSTVNIACVSGGFPSSQTFTEVKIAETALAVADGADEIDIVMNVGDYLSGSYEEMCDEIEEIKHSCHSAKLKVILETGALPTQQDVYKASILAMYSGADFIKTSTGKIAQGASLDAVYTMCKAIKAYHAACSKMVGIKVAGGITTAEEAAMYYSVVKEVLGDTWLTPEFFRIGASRLVDNLMKEIVK